MITAFERRATFLEKPFELELTWDRSRAYTVSYKDFNDLFDRGKREQKADLKMGRSADDRYLIIDSYCEIEVFDSISELAPIVRPRLLVILGIITFVTGEAMSTFGFSSIFTNIAEPGATVLENEPLLLSRSRDYSAELKEMVNAMKNLSVEKQILVYSLLDRWRKASYLVEKDEGSYLYEDETILACFHILELLGAQYGDLLDNDMNDKVQAFTSDILENVFFSKNINVQSELARLIHTALNSQKSVRPKILRMFQELGLLNPKSKALVERFLNHRNAIAHGRENLYEAKAAIYPLKPFFNHLKDIYEDIEVIRIASARAIAAYLKISLWEKEWENFTEEEFPVYEEVQAFNRARIYENMSWQEIENGAEQNVNVGVLIHYYRKGMLPIQPFGMALAKYIHEAKRSEENAYLILYTAAILADSTSATVAASAQEQIAKLYEEGLLAKYEFRDVMKELIYQNRPPQWLKSYLIELSK